MTIVNMNYYPYVRIVTKINDQNEQVEERREPEIHFLPELLTQMETYGAYYIKYLRFKDKVTLLPLMPDKQALSEI